MTTSSSRGDQRSSCLRLFMRDLLLVDHGAGLAHGADVAAQLVHDAGEFGV
jgi:hypothetical protein